MAIEKEDFAKNFSERLKRALDGRTHTAVSERLGCSRALLSKYLSGDIPDTFWLLAKLAEEYKVDLHDLLTGQPSPSIAEVEKRLKPFVYAHLAEVTQKIKNLQDERSQRPSRLVEHEINEQVEDLNLYYKAVLKGLNEGLKPYGIKI